MNRKRSLLLNTFCGKKRRFGADNLVGHPEHGDFQDGPCDVKATLQYLMTLFPRKLFEDRLPPVVFKHQLYSLLSDKTLVDKQLWSDEIQESLKKQVCYEAANTIVQRQNDLRDQGEVLMFHLGFDSDTFALVFTEDYRAKVLAGQTGRDTYATVEKFLDKALHGCSGLSFSKDKMLKELLFTDSEITKLVKSGVLTVRDAGSWWLAIPNSGRFTKYFINGRKAVLGMVKKSKYNEILKADLEERRTPSQVKLHIKYHVHDLIGAELVECIQTTSGALLRFVDT